MAELVSAWTDKKSVRLVERQGDGIKIRSVPARWSMFVTGLDESDRSTVGRDPRVTGVSYSDPYTRIDCKDRWARRDIEDAMKKAQTANPDASIRILEADVSPLRRLMADVGSLQVDQNPRFGYFDLETDSRKSFTEMKEGQARILSWALCSKTGEHWEAVLAEDSDDSERELLGEFIEQLWNFDCLLAWNGSGFDFLVIQQRCEVLGVRFRGRDVPWYRWAWLDHLAVFKKYNMHSDGGGEQKTSFKLQHVATYLLGEGKDDFDASKTWEAWESGGEERARLLRYNVKDTTLLPRIEEKTGFLGLHLAVCHICRIFPDTDSLNATAQGDGFLLRLGTEHGYRWKTKTRFDDSFVPTKFKGAYVMEPTKTGAIESVHVCDFAGLYPSIMRTFNMSPDTKVDGAQEKALAEKFHSQELGGENFSGIVPEIEPGICQLPNRSTWFRTDTDGMFRIALDRLVAKRAEYQSEMKQETPGTAAHTRAKRLQGAFKIVANSFYGITGSPWSRFFDSELAEGVTQTGRWLLESVIAEAKARDLDPFYGDTDSVFIAGGVGSMKSLVAHMNQTWESRLTPWGVVRSASGFGPVHHIDLDFEKTFSRIILISAKRYAGRFLMYKGKAAAADAKPEVKGLEFKRGDTIRLARDMQSEVVNMLLQEKMPEPSDFIQVIERWRSKVLKGKLELGDMVMSQSLSKKIEEYATRFASDRCNRPNCGYDFQSKDKHGPRKCPKCGTKRGISGLPAHVRVAKGMAEAGNPLGVGDRVSYVVVGATDGIEAIPANDPEAFKRADRVYYWERRIYPATGRVLEKVFPGVHWGESKGISKDRAAENSGQTRLEFGPTPHPKRRRRKKQPTHTTTPEVAPRRRRKIKSGRPMAEVAEVAQGAPRRRRRKIKPASDVVITLMENTSDESGGAEKFARARKMEAIKAAIEAYPGAHKVTIRISWRDIFNDHATKVKVEFPTGLGISKSTDARNALERVAVPGKVEGF